MLLILELRFLDVRFVLKDRGIIIERGFMFNKLISPFIEMLEKRGWQLLGKHKEPSFVTWVKEFYANMVGVKWKAVCVKGKWISFSGEKINETFNLKVQKDGSKLKKPEDCGLANMRKRKMEGNKENPT